MNVFRLVGDLFHLSALVILLMKIWRTKSCAGISGKSQLLFALVFTTRYLDLFTSFISIYNTFMKLFFLGVSYSTVFMIYVSFRSSYESQKDMFRLEVLLVLVAGLSLMVNHVFSFLEILWTFSIYLEAVAILPQMFMISQTWEAESVVLQYMVCLGLYRGLYLVNWMWRFYFEGFFDLIAIFSGLVQTIIYCIFFYLYFTRDISTNASEKNAPSPAPVPIKTPPCVFVNILPPTYSNFADLSGVPLKNNKQLQTELKEQLDQSQQGIN